MGQSFLTQAKKTQPLSNIAGKPGLYIKEVKTEISFIACRGSRQLNANLVTDENRPHQRCIRNFGPPLPFPIYRAQFPRANIPEERRKVGSWMEGWIRCHITSAAPWVMCRIGFAFLPLPLAPSSAHSSSSSCTLHHLRLRPRALWRSHSQTEGNEGSTG